MQQENNQSQETNQSEQNDQQQINQSEQTNQSEQNDQQQSNDQPGEVKDIETFEQPEPLPETLEPVQSNPDDLIQVKSINNCLRLASSRPVPKMLFGKFWYEGELCILFADSNLGKSILAVQIGHSISSGNCIAPFEIEAKPQSVLYCDFELTDKQFEARYSVDYENHYTFKHDFYRADMNMDKGVPEGFKDFDEYLIAGFERAIVQNKVKVLIVDNLTYLRSETEQAKDALPLMKELKALKKKHDLSMLVLAHTPKRDLSQQITLNDLQGSKMLMNFCDSAFTIGESTQGKGLRYLKQIKQRNTEQVYGYDNICVCSISKPFNFLQYEFVNYGNELDHLRKLKAPAKNEHMDEVVTLRLQGLTLRDIADKLGLTLGKVDWLLKAANKANKKE